MRWTHLVPKILILLALSGLLAPGVTVAQATPEPQVESDGQGVSLTWSPPAYSLTTVEVGSETYSQLHIPGTVSSSQPGQPELPGYSGLVGLPATGEARLRIVEIEREVVQLPYPPLPAPVPQPVSSTSIDPQSPPLGGLVALVPDPAIYASNDFFPQDVAELGPVQQLRHQRVARLIIRPLRVKPASNQMEVIRRIQLEITFDEPAPNNLSGLSNQTQSTPFAQALASTLLNPEARQWQAAPPSLAAQSITALSGENLVKVRVNKAGFYALTYDDLVAAGLPLDSLDPRTVQLSHGWPRQEVAILVEGEANGRFDRSDRILFYAEPEFSRFVGFDVYFLGYGQTTGMRMSSRSANPGDRPNGIAWRTTTAEVNQFYEPHYRGRNGDYWYWAELRQPDQTSGTYDIELETPLTTGPDATLSLWLQGYTDPAANPDHRMAVSVNGTSVGEWAWDGAQAIEATFPVPADILRSGTNQVVLSLPGIAGLRIEGTWLDALAITYPISQGGSNQLIFEGETDQRLYTITGWPTENLRVFDVTDAANPRQLTGFELNPTNSTYTLRLEDTEAVPAKYLIVPNDRFRSPRSIEAAASFSTPANGADYIIVTHPELADAVAPLAAHRAGQGLRVITVNVETIYDVFGSGRMDPEAIKTFLHYAYTTWTAPAPTYVLLVGDGSYDFKNYSGYNPPTFIPPYLAHVDPWWGETAADNQFVTLAGDDALPELLIGRLAVNSAAEAATVVDKIIRYETTPSPGDWNARQLFVADDDETGHNLYFHADADRGYSQVQAPFTGQRLYYGNGGESYIYANVETLRPTFLNQFNSGASIVTFHGHSSWLQWAVEGILRYYPYPYSGPNDLTAMRNQYRLPVVLQMTCFTGSFHRPEVATLDESLLRLSGGGAIAVWGSTGLGVSTGHVALQRGFYRAINSRENELGTAVLAGKIELNATGSHQELLDTFILFGDPALTMNFTIVPAAPYAGHVFLPLIMH